MDPSRFDALTRVMSQVIRPSSSRRAMLAAFGGLLTSALGRSLKTDAKRRRKKVRGRVRHRKQKGKHKTPPCPTGQVRCETGCAGCCSDADCGGNACLDGRCAHCPRDHRLCRGGCIAETACCSDGECTGSRTCIDGACACRANERLCQGACIPKDDCCGNDCPPPPTCSPADCGGCCDGATCKDGDSQNFCGRGGVECGQCQQREVCDAGQCVCLTECCADIHCSAGEGGLCRPNGACVYQPDCLPAGEQPLTCNADLNTCCSGECGDLFLETCGKSSANERCLTGADCERGNCEFYACVA